MNHLNLPKWQLIAIPAVSIILGVFYFGKYYVADELILARQQVASLEQDLQTARENLVRGVDDDLIQQRAAEPERRDRRVHIGVKISRTEARFVVRDEGRGFDVAAMPKSSDPGALVQDGGRGLILMGTFMDEVTYNDAGNEVTMVKRAAD